MRSRKQYTVLFVAYCNNVVIYRNINFNSLADCKMLDKRTLRIGVEFRNYI